MKNPYKKILSQKILYKNKWITLREDKFEKHDGECGEYYIVMPNETNKFVFVVAKDEKNNFYLVKQWRYPINKETIEFCAGSVEKNETPLKTAKRELFEELGLASKNWKLIGKKIGSPGFSKNEMYIYLADKAKIVDEEYHNNEEYTERLILKEKELKEFIKTNKISDVATIAAYFQYLSFNNKI